MAEHRREGREGRAEAGAPAGVARDESADAGPVDAGPDEAAAALDADLAALKGERDELRDLAQRVQADFENYKKRMLREQTLQVARASAGLVEALLPVLDALESAEALLVSADEAVRKGVELVHSELLDVLEREGLARISPLGDPFDPERHEAVLIDDRDSGGEAVVAEVLRTGYAFKGRVLRPALVKVTGRGG